MPRATAAPRLGLAAAALFTAVLALYAPVRHYPFIQLDDNEYVFENPQVATGLSPDNVRWALTAYHSGHWHPLTWLSLMADCQWSKADPGALHLMNALLHALGSAVLLLALTTATGSFARSFVVAALFALHPLRVESVAWIAARKDVLSGLFVMLTLWAYASYARRGSVGRYLLVLVAFALGMLAKPTLAVVPCGLLLWDFWPLGRRTLPWAESPAVASAPVSAAAETADATAASASVKNARAALGGEAIAHAPTSLLRLVAEKIPLFVIAALTLTKTWAAQNAAGAVVGNAELPMAQRLANALWNYLLYLGSSFWPFDLAVFYPLRAIPPLQASLAALLLVALTFGCWKLRGRAPYLLMGWLWFCGMLLPVSGIVQFGGQSMADRYAYLPHLGLLLALVWAAADLCAACRLPRAVVVAASVLLVAGAAARSADQLRYWEGSIPLFEHALAVTKDNYFVHNNLGVVLEAMGRQAEADAHYEEAVRINPRWPESQNNYGITLAKRGLLADARRHWEQALRVRPGFPRAENNIGTSYGREGNFAAAIPHYRRAVELDPSYFEAVYALADALERTGNRDEAVARYRATLALRPGFPPAVAGLQRLGAS